MTHTIRELPIVVGKQKVPDAWIFEFAANAPTEILQVWTKTTVRDSGHAIDVLTSNRLQKGWLRIRTPMGRPEGHKSVVVVAEDRSGSTSLPKECGGYHGEFINGARRWFVFGLAPRSDGESCSLPSVRGGLSESPGPPEL